MNFSHTVVFIFLSFSMNFFYNSISDQRVDFLDFERLFKHFSGENHPTFYKLGMVYEGLTRDDREDIDDYLKTYIFDVRFRQIIAQS